MKILLITDAWLPHENAAVRQWVALVRALKALDHGVEVLHPGRFAHVRGPSALGIDIALWPMQALAAAMQAAEPEAIHIATTGPLGWAAREQCLRHGWPFTSSVSPSFTGPLGQRLAASFGGAVQRLQRRFHAPSQRVLAATHTQQLSLQSQGLPQVRVWQPGVDTCLFAPQTGAGPTAALGPLARPVSLYVGPVAAGQSLEEFLALDVSGSKLVCGSGPMAEAWRHAHPQVHWLGAVPRHWLAQVYAAADVMVMPARDDARLSTVLESLACGTPVAAHSLDALVHCFGQRPAVAMHADLHQAWTEALRLPRHVVREQAQRFAWPRAARRFVAELSPLSHDHLPLVDTGLAWGPATMSLGAATSVTA